MTLNWRCIQTDLAEAKEELDDILAALEGEGGMDEYDYLVRLQHAYGHLSIAWNARRSTLETYRRMSQRDFTRWRKLPEGNEWNRMHRGHGRSRRGAGRA